EGKLATAEQDLRAGLGSEAAVAPLRTARDAAQKEREAAEAAYTTARVKAEGLWAEVKQQAGGAVFSEPLSPAEARRALPAGTLFVAFSVGEKASTLFLLEGGRDTQPRAYPVPLGEKQLQEAV